MSGNIQSMYVPTLHAAMGWGLQNENQLRQLAVDPSICKRFDLCLNDDAAIDPALLRDVFVTMVAAERDLPQPTHEVTASLAKLIKVALALRAPNISRPDFESAVSAVPGFVKRLSEAQTVALDAKSHLARFLVSARIAAGESVGIVMEKPERKSAFAAISSLFQQASGPTLVSIPEVRDSHSSVSPQTIASMFTLATYQYVGARDFAYDALHIALKTVRPSNDSISPSLLRGIALRLAVKIQAQLKPQVARAARDREIRQFFDLKNDEYPPSQRLALFAEAARLTEAD